MGSVGVEFGERMCLQKLVKAKSKFLIGKKAAASLGLVQVMNENVEKYRALGTRVYTMGDKYTTESKQLIRKTDRRRF